MMQLLPIMLVATVLAADGELARQLRLEALAWPWRAALVIALHALAVLVLWGVLRRCIHRLDRGQGALALLQTDRAIRIASWSIALIHVVSVIALGSLDLVRNVTGNLIGVDEIIAILPPVLAMMGLWWFSYPIEQRTRLAMLLRHMDEGRPIHDLPSRWSYVVQQLRIHMLFMLVPLLCILTVGEALMFIGREMDASWLRAVLVDLGLPLAALGIFVLAPLLMIVVLDVRRIADGELRDDLMKVCTAHRVKVRELLMWRTGGIMINAAVMGLLAPLRFVLITDGLLEQMSRRELLAVMAHEIGHVRRHHMPWMILSLIAILIVSSIVIWVPLVSLAALNVASRDVLAWTEVFMTGGALLVALLMFGWVSRRFERQADTFAVHHLSMHNSAWPQRDASTMPGSGAWRGLLALDDPQAIARLADAYAAGYRPFGAAGDERPFTALVEQSTSSSEVDRVDEAADSGTALANRVTAESVSAMNAALDRIARINLIDPHRPSWRHGSIAWRQSYLHSIIGQPLRSLRIDRVVRRIKLASLVIILSAIAAEVTMQVMFRGPSQQSDQRELQWAQESSESTRATLGRCNDAGLVNHAAWEAT